MKHFFTYVFLLFTLPLFARTYPGNPHAPQKVTCIVLSAVTITPEHCGQADGSISLVHDGTAPFTYTWSHNAALNTSSATGLAAGSYTIQIRDNNGCSADTVVTLAAAAPVQLLATTLPDTCGTGKGSATVSVASGGVAPFTFLWDPVAGSQNTPTASGLTPGGYAVQVSDAEGCTSTLVVQVGNVSNGLNVQISTQPLTCFGDSSGAASAVPAGGSGGYLYQWTVFGGTTVVGTDSLVNGLAAGGYTLTLTSGQGTGCRISRTFSVRQPTQVLPNASIRPATGCRLTDGAGYINPTGGKTPYTFLWSNGSTNDTASGLVPGIYTVTVTDSVGCIGRQEVVVSSTTGPAFVVEVLQEDNCGLGQGIARANINIGRAPFRLDWRTNPAQPDTALYARNLFASGGDLYSVIVMDADSCFGVLSFQMPGRDRIEVVSSDSTTDYCGLANGSATVTFRGGTAPYSYLWTTQPPQTLQTASDLPAGIYQVTLRDSFNCTIREQVTVTAEAGFTISNTSTDETCFGRSDGTATVQVSGGRAPTSYEWDNGAGGPSIANLEGGAYEVFVRDSAGCARSGISIVQDAPEIQAAFESRPEAGDTLILGEASVAFVNRSEGGETFLWKFGYGPTSTDLAPVHTFPDTGSYYVTLIVRNTASQCIDSVRQGPYHVVLDGKLYIPNAFTPNNDGFNDELIVGGDQISNYHLRIFNRWGFLVYESNSVSDSWNGRANGTGKAVPGGVYVYHLTAVLPGRKVEEKGTITVLR